MSKQFTCECESRDLIDTLNTTDQNTLFFCFFLMKICVSRDTLYVNDHLRVNASCFDCESASD